MLPVACALAGRGTSPSSTANTNAAAELVLFQLGLRLIGRREEIPRLQGVITIELPRGAVQRIRAGLRDDVHDGPGVAAELRIVGVSLNFEFLDRIGRWTHHEASIEGVVIAGAVEQEVVRLITHAIDAEAGGHGAESARGGIASRAAKTCWRGDDPRDERPQLREVPPVQRQLDDFLLIDGDAERRV